MSLTLRIAMLLVVTAFSVPTAAQKRVFNIYDGGRIPRSLQPSLIERLNLFVESQRTGNWDRVSELLGPFFCERERKKYSDAQRQWTVDYLRHEPMARFTPTLVTFTTAILSRPFDKRWWFIAGDAEYSTGTTPASRPAQITAYRYRGKWYFSLREITDFGSKPVIPTASNKSLDARGGGVFRN
jgi:hypothetical protein